MAWFKGDDRLYDDEDLDYMSPSAVCLHFIATSWSSHKQTDGFIPEERCKKLFGYSPGALSDLLSKCDPKNQPWWLKVPGGYQVRSFLKFNPSAEQVDQALRQRKEAGARSAEKRWGAERNQPRLPNETDNESLYEPPNESLNEKPNASLRKTPENRNENNAPYPVSRIPYPGEREKEAETSLETTIVDTRPRENGAIAPNSAGFRSIASLNGKTDPDPPPKAASKPPGEPPSPALIEANERLLAQRRATSAEKEAFDAG